MIREGPSHCRGGDRFNPMKKKKHLVKVKFRMKFMQGKRKTTGRSLFANRGQDD